MAAAAPPPPLTGAALALNDAQIERFSRQIVLPEIGGAGQARLLATTVRLLGAGRLAEIAALYLAGAGIGRIVLEPANAELAGALSDLHPDLVVASEAAAGDVTVACDAELAAVAAAAIGGGVMIAAGVDDGGGWLAVGQPGTCALCAARPHAAAERHLEGALTSAAAGVLGSLIALEVVKLRLGQGRPARNACQVDLTEMTLTERPIVPDPHCPACAVTPAAPE